MSVDGAAEGDPRAHCDAGSEQGDQPAAAAGPGANLQHQHCPVRDTTPLPGAGVRRKTSASTLLYLLFFIMSSVLLYHQAKQGQSAGEESSVLSDLHSLKAQLEESEGGRKLLETQLSEANSTITRMQQEGMF